LAQFTGTNVIDGTDDVIALSTFGTVTGQPVLLRYTLASGGANTFTANNSDLTISVTGGDTASTYNAGTRLSNADTITGTAGSDTLNITGSGVGSTNVSAIETINFTTSTASQTFETGALRLPNTGVITAAASTVAVTIDATALTITTAGTIVDGPGNDTISLPSADGQRAVTTLTLSSGGSDRVNLVDAANAGTAVGAVSGAATINNFTTGIGAGSDRLLLQYTAGTLLTTFQVISTAGTAVAAAPSTVIAIASSLGTLSDFTAIAADLAVENLIANAVGTSAANTADFFVIAYGSGANSGRAAVYHAYTTANNQEVTAANTVVDIVGILTGITADSFVAGNIL
jgi:hypothetical protein